MPRYRDAEGESVLERAVRLLDAFDSRTPSMSVSELARRADLPLSTAARLATELERLGLLQRDRQRRLHIGVRFWELASRAAPTRELREAALPFMEDLHSVVRHHTQLGVLDGGEVLFVERLSWPDAVINVTQIAGRLPLHASSAGLVLLAHAPQDQQAAALERPMRRYTRATVSDPGELRVLLAEVRRQGYVYSPGYIHADAAGVAVPVRDAEDRVVAALGVVVPNDEFAIRTVPALRASARGIQRMLRPPNPSH